MRAASIRLCAGAVALASAAPAPARAEPPEFAATYGIAFLGLTVGEATLGLTREGGGRYTLALRATLRGLAGFFLDGEGSVLAAGRLSRGSASAGSFTVDSRYSGKPIRVAMRIEGGRVREAEVEPPATPRPDRVLVTEADKVGVLDPLSALLVPLAGDPTDPGTCDRRIPIFDGAMRADLVLSRGALVTVAEGPYRGPALDCRVRWVPVAGHRANGPSVRRMAENDEMRVRLAPVPGGGVLVPLAITVATGWGTVRIAATRWEAGAGSEAARAGVKLRLPNAR